MTVKNTTWNLLEKRAQDRVEVAMAESSAAAQAISGLECSQSRLNKLLSEYLSRLETVENDVHSIGDNMNCRRYIAHIEEVKRKLDFSLHAARERHAAAIRTQRKLVAEREKMAGMADRAKKAEERGRAIQDQKRLDNLALAQYNLRKA